MTIDVNTNNAASYNKIDEPETALVPQLADARGYALRIRPIHLYAFVLGTTPRP